jgi:hypothetical protein
MYPVLSAKTHYMGRSYRQDSNNGGTPTPDRQPGNPLFHIVLSVYQSLDLFPLQKGSDIF